MPRSKTKKTICGLPNIRVLGEGEQGVVYKVLDPKDGTIKALKINEDPIRSLPEVSILCSIRHPNLLHCERLIPNKDCSDTLPMLIPIMYSDLNKLPRNITWNELRLIFYAVASGLAVLHHNKILHLDLKLENILWTICDGQIRSVISDFGLSEYVDNVTTPVDFGGLRIARAYRPVENLREGRSDYYNGASDIWSLAQTMMELFTGKTLNHMSETFSDTEEEAWFSRYLRPGPQIKHSIKTRFEDVTYGADDNFVDLISKMLDLDWEKRPTIDNVLRHPFFSGLTSISNEKSRVNVVKSYPVKVIPFDMLYKEYNAIMGSGKPDDNVLYLAASLLYRLPTSKGLVVNVLLIALNFYNYYDSASEVSHKLGDLLNLVYSLEGKIYDDDIINTMKRIGLVELSKDSKSLSKILNEIDIFNEHFTSDISYLLQEYLR